MVHLKKKYLAPNPFTKKKRQHPHPLLPNRGISEENENDDDDNDVDEDDETTLLSDSDEEQMGYFNKEPILLTIKNGLVDLLKEIDVGYGDLITFPVFQEFVRSHTSSLVYGPVKKRDNRNKNKKRSS